jgi:hypothetical protein
MEMTDDVALTEGDYELVIDVAESPIVLPQALSAVRGRSYTVVLVGLVAADGTAEADDGGFFAWLEGLFTPDRPELGLQALVLDDVAPMVLGPQEMRLRIVHAAPGTAEVELVQVANGAVHVLGTAEYLDIGGFHTVLHGAGRFEIRAVGTAAPIIELEAVGFEPALTHTVLLTGTPIEEVPLQAMVLTFAPVDPAVAAPVAPAIGPAWPPGGEIVWIRDYLIEAAQRIAVADQWPNQTDAGAEARESVAAARNDLGVARELVDWILADLDTAQQRGVVTPGAPPAVLTPPAEPSPGGD